MIVVDSSALMASILRENDFEELSEVLNASEAKIIGAPTRLELLMVASGRRREALRSLALELLQDARIETVPFNSAHADIAADAFLRYGKGTGHPAQLNYGDCMAYAVAKALDAPLLYKGDDFAQTDIRSALDV